MSEHHATYDHADPDEPPEGTKPNGDILRQLVDARGWSPPQASSEPMAPAPLTPEHITMAEPTSQLSPLGPAEHNLPTAVTA